LLAALPKKDYQRLLPQLEHVALTFGEILCEPGARIRHVYFPNDLIISLLSTVESRKAVEVGIVGNDGIAGLSTLLGASASLYRMLVQGEGSAMRMKTGALRKEFKQDGNMQSLLNRYTHALMTQISQTAACYRFHMVNARLARWLLMTHDRMGSNEFRLTQEFLSHMLGVRREGVSKAANILQQQKLITYTRGNITILNRARLEAVACTCYSIVKDEYDSFLPFKNPAIATLRKTH